jgi:hypothetical protein
MYLDEKFSRFPSYLPVDEMLPESGGDDLNPASARELV